MKKVLIKSLKNWWSQLVNEIVEAVNLQQSKFLLKVASVTFFIFFFVSVKAQAENTNQFVTLNETNSSIEKIIVEIRTQTGYDFLYNARLMKDTKPVTIVVKNEYFKNKNKPEKLSKILINAVGFGGNAVSILLECV